MASRLAHHKLDLASFSFIIKGYVIQKVDIGLMIALIVYVVLNAGGLSKVLLHHEIMLEMLDTFTLVVSFSRMSII